MANKVYTILDISGDEEAMCDLLAMLRSPSGEFSFQQILPVPPLLEVEPCSDVDFFVAVLDGTDVTSMPEGEWLLGMLGAYGLPATPSGVGRLATTDAHWKGRYIRSLVHLAIRQRNNKRVYGVTNRADWCRANWGVETDCREMLVKNTDFKNISIRITTSWGFPHGILRCLVSRFPQLCFNGDVFEELGNFQGKIFNGVVKPCKSWRDEAEEDYATPLKE